MPNHPNTLVRGWLLTRDLNVKTNPLKGWNVLKDSDEITQDTLNGNYPSRPSDNAPKMYYKPINILLDVLMYNTQGHVDHLKTQSMMPEQVHQFGALQQVQAINSTLQLMNISLFVHSIVRVNELGRYGPKDVLYTADDWADLTLDLTVQPSNKAWDKGHNMLDRLSWHYTRGINDTTSKIKEWRSLITHATNIPLKTLVHEGIYHDE